MKSSVRQQLQKPLAGTTQTVVQWRERWHSGAIGGAAARATTRSEARVTVGTEA